jgi:hypothetical protein
MTLVNFCTIVCSVSLLFVFIGAVLYNTELTQIAGIAAAVSGGVLVLTHVFNSIQE